MSVPHIDGRRFVIYVVRPEDVGTIMSGKCRISNLPSTSTLLSIYYNHERLCYHFVFADKSFEVTHPNGEALKRKAEVEFTPLFYLHERKDKKVNETIPF
jgi:hypothetical protein